MLSVSDVWKMMNEKRPRNEHLTVSQRLDKARIKQAIDEELRNVDFSQIHIEPELAKYKPSLRSHEYWRLTWEDQHIINAAIELGLIPDSHDDCRDDLIAAYAITDEQWEAAREKHRNHINDEVTTDDSDIAYEEWLAAKALAEDDESDCTYEAHESDSENWGI